MNRLAKPYGIAIAGIAAAVLVGCGGSDATSGAVADSSGFFNLSISDGPIKDATKVCIKFDGVQLKKADEEAPISIDFDAPEVVNLLAHQGANSRSILTNELVPAGQYEWIRLMVDASRGGSGADDGDPTTDTCLAEDGSYLVRETGEVFNLFIPSGDQSGLKLIKDITVPVNASGNYTAEWDLGKSFIAPPGLAPDVIMKPVVKLVANNEVGTLVGQVADGIVEADSCDAEFAPKVYVFADGVEPNPIDYPSDDPDATFDPDPNDPVATGLVELQEQNDGSMQYRYSIGFLLADLYDPVFTCDGETFVLPLDDQPEALIKAGETTTVDFELDTSGG